MCDIEAEPALAAGARFAPCIGMKSILVGVDGSAESACAARLAAGIARASNRQLVFAHVLAPVTTLPAPVPSAGDDERTRAARHMLEAFAQREASWGTDPQIEVLTGNPADVLSRRAAEGDVDLVVVGHRGRGAVARALLGSVADRLVQLSPAPVLVAR
jgi:nucleotide-binding universal stress UspA family protein